MEAGLSEKAQPVTVMAEDEEADFFLACETEQEMGIKDVIRLLISLKTSLTQKIDNVITELRESRNKLNEAWSRSYHNDRRINSLEKENKFLSDKVEGLENRLKKRNLIFKSVPIQIQKDDLIPKIGDWIRANGFDLDSSLVDQAFRAPKRFSSPDSPPDVVLHFTRESIAEQIWKHFRKPPKAKLMGQQIRVYQDLSITTLKRRAALRPITKRILDAGFKYTWLAPASLLLFNGNHKYIASDFTEGVALLKELSISTDGIYAERDPKLMDFLPSKSGTMVSSGEVDDEAMEVSQSQDDRRPSRKRPEPMQPGIRKFLLEDRSSLKPQDQKATAAPPPRKQAKGKHCG